MTLPLRENEEDEVLHDAEFTLEYQLRDFIAQNIEAIPLEGRKLSLYIDANDRDGVEYPTDVGRIDILVVDEKGDLVVFELKRARSPDRAIGQLARYMGWVRQTIGREQRVRGVIVAKTISEGLRIRGHGYSRRERFRVRRALHLEIRQRTCRKRGPNSPIDSSCATPSPFSS